MRAVLQAVPDVFMWLEQNGTIRELQSQGVEELMLEREQMIGKRVQDVPNVAVAREFEEGLERLKRTGQGSTFEYLLTISDKERRFEARILPTVRGGVLAVIRDVTLRHEAEVERRKHSKLESVGILAGGIAHDFNNILSVISAGVSLARFEIEDNQLDAASEMLGETEVAVRRASGLTKQLLTFARGGAPVRAAASIAEILHESARFALRGSNVVVDVDVDEDLFSAEIDQGQISQVVNNLVINAMQAMPNGGVLKIRARNRMRSDLSHSAWVQIVVSDEGCGIADEHIDFIFDPYFTTKATGNGLGLATSYSIIAQHSGEMRVESTVGKGSSFEILLPASGLAEVEKLPPAREIKGGRGRVLLVDDELPITRLGSRMLQLMGYEVETAADGGAAFQLFDAALRRSMPFDLVILDLTIPGGMGGKETAAHLWQLDPDCPIVASSGYCNDPVMSDYRAYHFSAILPKPYDMATMGELLTEMIPAEIA